MTYPSYFNANKSENLFGLYENFEFLNNLYIKKKLPKVIMLSGKKGSGKSTLVNHFMFSIFDKINYNYKTNKLNINTSFYNQFSKNLFSNIIYLSGSEIKNSKIEDIRNLKDKIFQTSISNRPRFIIFDDIELFNINSLNALLKIIEEPTKNNYFILINNKTKPLIETIKSRCLEFKIILKETQRINIIESLVAKYKVELAINLNFQQLTPGQFIKFNFILNEYKISLEDDFLKNLSLFFNLYKKNKDTLFIDIILFLNNYYLNKLKDKNIFTNEKIIEIKRFVFENVNKFFLYNLNQNAVLNIITNKINGR